VLQRHVPLHEYIGRCHLRCVEVMGVITSSSLEVRDEHGNVVGAMSFEDAATMYAAEYAGLLDYWEIGNETDADPNGPIDGSWILPAADCSRLIQAFVSAIKAQRSDAYITGPGLISGQPDYVRQLDLSGLTAISIHPYNQTPATAKVLFEHNYKELLDAGFQICITEFGMADADPGVRGAYLHDMVEQFQQLGYIDMALWYCWSRIQHSSPFFVVDQDENGVVIPTAVSAITLGLGFVQPVMV